ncbi:MAG: glycosyltransferase [Acidobacteria bacterium]|nr:glycosyltransferase [Acidobacteriota bacterium]
MITLGCVVAIGYQIFALLACLRFLARRDPEPAGTPPVSILKPVHGRDPEFREAIESHARIEYPAYEVLFCAATVADPAMEDVRRLKDGPLGLRVAIVPGVTSFPNGKVGRLRDLAAAARFDTLVVNDSDIRVRPDYLHRITAPLADPQVGMVTCLYRARAKHLPAIAEAVGIATDFAPSTLVAPFVGVKEFGLGSTLVFRRRDLEAIGGFEALADYIADDYQLAKRITGLGLRVHLSRTVVETSLQGETWAEVWAHQLRWNRTIRVSRGAYAGLFVTQATAWALAAAATGLWSLAALTLAARMAMALTAGLAVLRCPLTARYWWLVPARDLFGTAVWVAGLAGNRVQWRDKAIRLTADGRIEP